MRTTAEGVYSLSLLHAFSIGLGERRFALQSSDSQGELGHGVQVIRAAVDELLNELGHIGTSGPFGGEIADLLLAGNLAGQQQPEETFRERLLAAGSFGKQLLALGNLQCLISIM